MESISTTIHAFHTMSDASHDKSAFRLLDLGSISVSPFDRRRNFPSKERGNGCVDYLPIDVEVSQTVQDLSTLEA